MKSNKHSKEGRWMTNRTMEGIRKATEMERMVFGQWLGNGDSH
jgi:hypothetical protein